MNINLFSFTFFKNLSVVIMFWLIGFFFFWITVCRTYCVCDKCLYNRYKFRYKSIANSPNLRWCVHYRVKNASLVEKYYFFVKDFIVLERVEKVAIHSPKMSSSDRCARTWKTAYKRFTRIIHVKYCHCCYEWY